MPAEVDDLTDNCLTPNPTLGRKSENQGLTDSKALRSEMTTQQPPQPTEDPMPAKRNTQQQPPPPPAIAIPTVPSVADAARAIPTPPAEMVEFFDFDRYAADITQPATSSPRSAAVERPSQSPRQGRHR
jgi:hypothetical protein